MVDGTLPDSVVPFRARYNGACICGRYIRSGEKLYKDRDTDRLMCRFCVEKINADVIDSASRVCAVMDRIAQIRALPAPVSAKILIELQDLLRELEHEHADTRQARNFLSREIGLPADASDYKIIAAKYASKCNRCKCEIHERRAALWSQSSRKIWCLECAEEIIGDILLF